MAWILREGTRAASECGRPEEVVQTPGIQRPIQPRINLLQGSRGNLRQNIRRDGTKTLLDKDVGHGRPATATVVEDDGQDCFYRRREASNANIPIPTSRDEAGSGTSPVEAGVTVTFPQVSGTR